MTVIGFDETKADYLVRVRRAAEALVRERYLLSEDVELVVENCGARYDEALRVGAVEAVAVGSAASGTPGGSR